MSEKFDSALKEIFECSRGAFSVVTADENKKSQLTFVGPEQDIAEELIPDIELRVGNKNEIEAAAGSKQVKVRRWPDGAEIDLTVGYKKKKGQKSNELRMYLNRDFKPAPGINWCVFDRDGQLWVGQFSPNAFQLGVNAPEKLTKSIRPLLEPELDDFQETVNSPDVKSVQSVLTRWKRNPKVAAEALSRAKYECEIFPDLQTFKIKGKNRPFMEAHHLIPMKVQPEFEVSLDQTVNICCLNPLSHRMLHHAEYEEIKDVVSKLCGAREDFLKELGISSDDVLGFYS
ncbi:hypothetical protein P8R33_08080 [Qipengyuania sp. XHP0211]|uniref:HNH endonuclease n=1 Tax=Qipengyuania sp. XHP0211 TaxID=3038079 RepID=UPI00241CC24A|nr:hypothetical protein [Qipengyuania sp. XHP0211]MDG5751059.1 hypothetical protein [Qipengyuania sp. XHP0211]